MCQRMRILYSAYIFATVPPASLSPCPCLIVTVPLCHCVSHAPVSLCPCVTVSLCHCVTASPCHCVTVSLCHLQARTISVASARAVQGQRHCAASSQGTSSPYSGQILTVPLCHCVTVSLCHSPAQGRYCGVPRGSPRAGATAVLVPGIPLLRLSGPDGAASWHGGGRGRGPAPSALSGRGPSC